MADNDNELIAEVRALTSYGADVISDPDMTSLVASAKEEILDAVDEDALDWYNVRSAERALFWLLALFTKVHTGQVGGAGFTIGELEQAPLLGTAEFWLTRFYQHLWKIGNAESFGITSVSRDDRTYDSTSTASTDSGLDDLL